MDFERTRIPSVSRLSLTRTERDLLDRLDHARTELDETMRAVWMSCVVGEVLDLRTRRLCDDALAEVDRLERELVSVRTSLRCMGDDAA
ncbi:MAG: hypothetical protein U1F36_18695 [Planctomycetota bacterium]